MTRNNEKTTAEFRLAMLEKLDMNNHKKHWNVASVSWLFMRLKMEVKELEDEITHMMRSADINDPHIRKEAIKYFSDRSVLECADVANMAMMVWDNLQNGIIEGSSDTDYLEPGRAGS
jgi:uncharacterized protein YigA (DUF484 family)